VSSLCRPKATTFDIGKQSISASYDAGIVTISETAFLTIHNSRATITNYLDGIREQLPDDECGSRATLGEPNIGVSGGQLIVGLPLSGEQWGCILNIQTLTASGSMTFNIFYSFSVNNGAANLIHKLVHSGSLQSTIPDISEELTSNVEAAIGEATEAAVNNVQKGVDDIQVQIKTLEENATDPTADASPIYHPQLQSIGFVQVAGDDLQIVRTRTVEARGGTACAIRKLLALQKWQSF
jgi:hypothetical protein